MNYKKFMQKDVNAINQDALRNIVNAIKQA